MYLIKLDAIDSTNSYLRTSASVSMPKDYTVVWSEIQTKGRGQMGTIWHSQEGKNLTFSVFKRNIGLDVNNQFVISMLVSMAIFRTLKKFQLPKLSIKWPNDILSEQYKICGILIENIVKNNTIAGSIIGVGLNVNQRFFDDLPSASSMYLLTGKLHNKEEIITEIVSSIKYYFKLLSQKTIPQLKQEYTNRLFRLNKPSTFKQNGKTFVGIIQGVKTNGQLIVRIEDEKIKTFDFKEITLLY